MIILMELKGVECPRCGSEHIDSLVNKFGRSIDAAMYGRCDCACRDCGYKFMKEKE